MSCCLLSASSSSICHVPLPYLFSKIAQCLHICFAGFLRGASAWWWINKPVFLGRWTSFHIQILRTKMFGRSWNSQLSPLVSLKSWFEKKNHMFDCLTMFDDVWRCLTMFDDVWRWPMFSDFSWFLSKFPTLPYLRKWTFQNGGHIYRAEVVVGRGRPLLCTLTATAAGRRGPGTTDPQRGGGKPCWWSRSEHDLYPLVI